MVQPHSLNIRVFTMFTVKLVGVGKFNNFTVVSLYSCAGRFEPDLIITLVH